MEQHVICIAGAHRSGTSLLARLLRECGLELGPENELMPPGEDNPDGFWENLRFVALNDDLLITVGAAWDLPPLPENSFESGDVAPIRAKAQLLVESFRTVPAWGWKDPRNSLTLPFWRALLPGLRTIIMVRNPLEVAYSMHKRNGLSYALGLRLWEIYNRSALTHSAPDTRLITSYQAFFDEPERELQKIAVFAGLCQSNVSAAASLIVAGRRHTTFSLEQMIDAGVSPDIISLYQSLTTGEARPSAEPAVQGSDPLAGARSRVVPSITEAEDIRRELAKRRGDEIAHREEIGRYQGTIDGLRKELNENAVRAMAEINRREGRIEELQKVFAERDQIALDLEKMRERFTQTNQLLQSVSVRLSDHEMRNVALIERLRKQLLEMKKLLRLLEQMDAAAGRLRHSRRWKIANPFAALRAAFTGKEPEGFGHLDKNVEKYRSWRAAHPEMDRLEEDIQALRSYELPAATVTPQSSAEAPAQPKSHPQPPAPIGPIEFARPNEPEVSIIIPVYNQVEFTRACLAAVQKNSGLVSYEIIVVDDCSTDETPEVIGSVPGLTYLRAEVNAGFIASCNHGAENARGQYLVFLNNDTTVTPDWLSALRETFRFEPDAGLVGSKLVYPDGRLQEAGGIIWRYGSGWNRGKFKDQADPEYNYLREVDYCSAASVMIPKEFFQALGGFDSKYAPAYYEDTDLAFKVAAAGRKVLYQPLSVVIHYEGISSGTDLAAGTKKYQEVNRRTFSASWPSTLARKPGNGDLAAFDAPPPGAKRILVIDHHLPMPDRDSGSLRMFQILTILQQLGHQVTFLPDNLADIPPYGDDLRKRGITVMHHPYTSKIADYLEKEGPHYDVVILSRCDFARKHMEHVRQFAPQSRVIFDTVDLHFLRTHREAELTRDPTIQEEGRAKEEAEYGLIDRADETWVVSTAEQELLAQARPDTVVHVISNIVDSPGSAVPFSARRDFLFIGSFQHTPNIDAVLFFAREIYPLVKPSISTAKFFIIGDKAPPEVIALADENVVVTGLVPDARAYFDNVKLSIAPLRYGAGVKGKINQSMGLGVPVIATSIAVEGMGLTDRKDVMVADEPAEFARALLEVYSSPVLWEQISKAGVHKTETTFSRATAERQLRYLFSELEQKPGGSKTPVAHAPELQTLASL
ncbi:MAG: glycosyltransferase [Chthoniobacterales bacterium]